MHTSTGTDSRLAALGNQLVEIHLSLREDLARLRDELDSRPANDGARTRDLRTHCLMFCSSVRRHHTDEDAGTFPALAKQFPGLHPVLDELVRDHEQVAAMLERLEELLAETRTPAARAEMDGLAALLESHFVYEEKKLVAALNSL